MQGFKSEFSKQIEVVIWSDKTFICLGIFNTIYSVDYTQTYVAGLCIVGQNYFFDFKKSKITDTFLW